MKYTYHIKMKDKFEKEALDKDICLEVVYINASTVYPVNWLNCNRGDKKGVDLYYTFINGILYPLYIKADTIEEAMNALIEEMRREAAYNPYNWKVI